MRIPFISDYMARQPYIPLQRPSIDLEDPPSARRDHTMTAFEFADIDAFDTGPIRAGSLLGAVPFTACLTTALTRLRPSAGCLINSTVNVCLIGVPVAMTGLACLFWLNTDYHPAQTYCSQFSNFSWIEPTSTIFTWTNVPANLTAPCLSLYGTDKTIANPMPHRPKWDGLSLDEAGPFPLRGDKVFPYQNEQTRYQYVIQSNDSRATLRSLNYTAAPPSVEEAVTQNLVFSTQFFVIAVFSGGLRYFLGDMFES